MKVLILVTGAPGAGKTTWIKENGLEQYTLSPDDIRLMHQTPEMSISGNFGISQKNDRAVWKTLFDLLEKRMARGEFTVIDATISKRADFNQYQKLAKEYRYRMYTVSFRDVPIDVCKARNRARHEYKQVPEEVIDKMYARFVSQHGSIPSWAPEVAKNNFWNAIDYMPADFSHYKRIHHIGDIHGCLDPLGRYFARFGINDDELYIFLGDYVDRGIQNFRTMELLLTLYQKPNVIMLEGNHERWLWLYANNQIDDIKSQEFLQKTMPELDKYGIDKKELRNFYRKLGQICYYAWNGKQVIVTHGGVPYIADRLITQSTQEFIKGVGRYKDAAAVAAAFDAHYSGREVYSIHGHRNIESLPVEVNEHVFNLEGKIEFGGHLRVVTLDESGFGTVEIKNNTFAEEKRLEVVEVKDAQSVSDLVNILRADKGIWEKKMGNISSFNFKRDVFNNDDWNDRTLTARGLFINTRINDVAIRSYNKMFNLGDNRHPEVSLEALGRNMQMPITAYEKVNGFLGLVGYDSDTDELVLASKSVIDGKYADLFKQQFFAHIRGEDEKKIKALLAYNNLTLVFECVDIKNDPHIIEYPESKIVLLDAVHRTIGFKKLSYDAVCNIGQTYGFPVKRKEAEFQTFAEFVDWYNQVMADDSIQEEGYVIEDANGLMVKIKLPYYNFWKHMRSIYMRVKGGKVHTVKQASLYNAKANYFFEFLRGKTRNELEKGDIISLRRAFEVEQLLNQSVAITNKELEIIRQKENDNVHSG